MRSRTATACAIAILSAAVAGAQATKKPPKRTDAEIAANVKAHKADFDYLLGQWKFSAVSKQYGKFEGLWTAMKLPGGEILDEYAILDGKGAKMYVSTTIRAYNAVLDQWELIGTDEARGLHDFGSGHRTPGGFEIEQTFGVMSPEPSTWRIHYRNIKPDSFSWSADRTTDGGKTWVTDFQTIEARRVAAAYDVAVFAPSPKRP
jgi:hypothetical protein